MAYSKRKEEYISVQEWNKHMKYCYNNRLVHERAKKPGETFGLNAFVEKGLVYMKLSYRRGTRACTYITRLDGKIENQKISGMEAFRILNKYYKVPRFTDEKILSLSASPFLWKNEKYEGQRIERAIGYDLNSAYSFGMLSKMPDTSKPYKAKKIVEGKEIGFKELYFNGKLSFRPVYSGHSQYVFPLMDSPFTKFVDRWYKLKQDPKMKAKAKCVLNYAVGYLQKVNPFLRAVIIDNCNMLISRLMDERTLYCNTDSIVTTFPMDLELGDGCGQWKIEHIGSFAYKGFNYQWGLNPPAYRGTPKSWFKKGWDILKDPLPQQGSIYYYEDYKIRRIKYEAQGQKK